MLDLITRSALLITLGLVACLAIAVFALLRSRRQLRELRREHRDAERAHQEREARRRRSCDELGHELDSSCVCRRCLTTCHDLERVGSEEIWIEDVPGAMWLDSNFQPEGHQERHPRLRCRRCQWEGVDWASTDDGEG